MLARFKELQQKWDHIPRGRSSELERISRFMGQVEMFYLAQAICSHEAPLLQGNLDALRRDLMDEVTNGPKDAGGQVNLTRVPQAHHWSDFQITPEFSLDPSLSGRFVSKNKIQNLNCLLKKQIKLVLERVRAFDGI